MEAQRMFRLSISSTLAQATAMRAYSGSHWKTASRSSGRSFLESSMQRRSFRGGVRSKTTAAA